MPNITFIEYPRINALEEEQLPQKPILLDYSDLEVNFPSVTFNINWESYPEALGYRLDVSSTSDFKNMFTSYNNLDVGNVLTKNIILSGVYYTYYYRIRAYTSNFISINSDVGILNIGD